MGPNESMSFLPALTSEELTTQVEHMLLQGHLPIIEYFEGPSRHDQYWRLWPLPKRDERSVQWVVAQLDACRRRYPYAHVKLTAYAQLNSSIANSFIAYLPSS